MSLETNTNIPQELKKLLNQDKNHEKEKAPETGWISGAYW